jgi:hypothetical protein
MNILQYWLNTWYFIKKDKDILVNPNNRISFIEFKFEYNFNTNKK